MEKQNNSSEKGRKEKKKKKQYICSWCFRKNAGSGYFDMAMTTPQNRSLLSVWMNYISKETRSQDQKFFVQRDMQNGNKKS